MQLEPQEQERFLRRLQEEGQRLTWAIGSTVYLLDGQRWVVFTLEQNERRPGEGPFRAELLPEEWGPDPYEAAANFMKAYRKS